MQLKNIGSPKTQASHPPRVEAQKTSSSLNIINAVHTSSETIATIFAPNSNLCLTSIDSRLLSSAQNPLSSINTRTLVQAAEKYQQTTEALATKEAIIGFMQNQTSYMGKTLSDWLRAKNIWQNLGDDPFLNAAFFPTHATALPYRVTRHIRKAFAMEPSLRAMHRTITDLAL